MQPAQPLSALESAFVTLSSRGAPFVYACIVELDRPIAVDRLRGHIDAMLSDLPRYHQRIVGSRWDVRPAQWVRDDDFRIERHVNELRVSAPGDDLTLHDLTAKLLGAPLPSEHPPWRVWTVDGLDRGRGAIIALLHHAFADGIAGFRLLERVLRGAQKADEARAPEPTAGRDERAGKPLGWRDVAALARLLRDGLRPASDLGINPRHTGLARFVGSHTVDLDAMKTIERAFGATNNDVVLATVTGGLRRFLVRSGVEDDRFANVRAMVPVGRHAKGERAASGNEVVLLLVPLPMREADPVARLRRISAATGKLKKSHMASAGDLLVSLSDSTTPLLLAGVLGLALRQRAFNVLVTNVPGPAAELSLLDASVKRIVPIVNLWPRQGIAVAATSYAGAMTFGVQADRACVEDCATLPVDLALEFDALLAAAKRVVTPAPVAQPSV